MPLRTQRYPQSHGRSTVLGSNGAIATSQPLAAAAGLSVLEEGGNAFDAAVAAMAALDVVEPMATGLGGDCFALCYLASSCEVRALNASGPSPARLTRDLILSRGYSSVAQAGIHSVTVPGALSGWWMLVEELGSLPFFRLVQRAIEYAQEGFPVTEVIAAAWQACREKLAAHPDSAKALLRPDGTAPGAGETFRQPDLAATYKKIAAGGPDAFYKGDIAKAMVKLSGSLDGTFSLEDFSRYRAEWAQPISTDYRGFEVLECPPNGQGIAALIALNIVENDDLVSLGHNTPDYLHLLIEAKKLALADRDRCVADPRFSEVSTSQLLQKDYARTRRKLIDESFASSPPPAGRFPSHGDTAYVTVVDGSGNACSLISSLFMSFGSGLVAGRTGICLQNRGAGFSLDPASPNCLEPRKRPFHTIIPGMVLQNGELFLSFGMIGGHMQPQGHLQLICNIIDFGMSPQQALEAPRFCHLQGRRVALEWPISEGVREQLAARGHDLSPPGTIHGGAQIIARDRDTGVLAAGSDPRKDGCALAY